MIIAQLLSALSFDQSSMNQFALPNNKQPNKSSFMFRLEKADLILKEVLFIFLTYKT